MTETPGELRDGRHGEQLGFVTCACSPPLATPLASVVQHAQTKSSYSAQMTAQPIDLDGVPWDVAAFLPA